MPTKLTLPKVIGLGGEFAAGKDAIADYLVFQYGYIKLGMSDSLAEALYTLNPFVYVTMPYGTRGGSRTTYVKYQTFVDKVGYVEAKKNPEVRRLLQVLGTEVGRDMISQDVWVDISRRRIKEIVSNGGKAVLTGVRFLNEIAMIKDLGTSAYVIRPNAPKAKTTTKQHKSETSLSSAMFDKVIMNDGTLEQLYANAIEVLGK